MSRMTNPDNDIIIAQQEKDLRHVERSQPGWAKSRQGGAPEEQIETDTMADERNGLALGRGASRSGTEEALERARRKVREQENLGRRRR